MQREAGDVMISAVIPVFNEQEVIDEFSTRLVESLEQIVPDYEIIFVVEGTDAREEKLSLLAKGNSRVRVHYSPKRLGLGPATRKGLELIDPNTDYVLIMDADLNHHPEEIGRLLEVSSQADIVVGCRSRERGLVNELPFFKRVVAGARTGYSGKHSESLVATLLPDSDSTPQRQSKRFGTG